MSFCTNYIYTEPEERENWALCLSQLCRTVECQYLMELDDDEDNVYLVFVQP